jgi:hypothetical protein
MFNVKKRLAFTKTTPAVPTRGLIKTPCHFNLEQQMALVDSRSSLIVFLKAEEPPKASDERDA